MTDATLVIDISENASPEEASAALNAPGDSYFLAQVLPIPGGHRAYLRRYKQTPTEMPVEKGDKGAEAALAELLRESPSLGINKLQAALRERGFKKGSTWVSNAKTKIQGTGVKRAEG